MDERESDGTPAGDGSGAAAGVDVERLREIKLMGFLRELDRREKRLATAALLGVNYKTVARALTNARYGGISLVDDAGQMQAVEPSQNSTAR